MPVVQKSAILPYSAEQIFELVADVEAYPDFLPWCRSSRLLARNGEEIRGELEVARLGIRQSFSTLNRIEPGRRMDIQLLKGPFKRLNGGWRFTPLGANACKVELALDFELSGSLIDKAFGTVFHQIANTLVDAFCQRATKVYGPPTTP